MRSVETAALRYAGAVQTSEIAELLRPYVGEEELDEELLLNISIYIDVLQTWNAHINLTAVRDPREIVARHFGESLFAARHLLARDSPAEVIDLGSGAGFPGIPLKLHARGIHLTLIEAHGKKATFLREVARRLQLSDVQVLNLRAELCTVKASLVTLRAVEKLERVLPAARGLVAPGGRLVLLTSRQRLALAKERLEGKWEVASMPVGEGVAAILLC